MNLSKRLGILEGPYEVISIQGAGGKTTTLMRLAKELSSEGKSVLVTTTTAMMMPDSEDYDFFLTKEEVEDHFEILESSAVRGKIAFLIGEMIHIDKVKGVEMPLIDKIKEHHLFDHILVETDGAQRKAIKAPREDEPLNPYSTDLVIGLIGLDSLGSPIDEDHIHRVAIFKKILAITDEKYLDEDLLSKLILHPKGLFKNATGKDKVLILNKADTIKIRDRGEIIREKLSGAGLKDILVLSLWNE